MQLLQSRSGCAFLPSHGTSPWKSGRLGGGALEALTAIVAVVLVALGIAASAGGGSFVDDFRTPGTQSQAAMDVLDERFAAAGDSANVVFAVDRDPAWAERRAAIDRTVEEIRAQPHVTAAPSPFERESGLLSENGRIAYVQVQYDGTASSLGAEPGSGSSRSRRVASVPASRCRATARSWTRPSRRPPPSAS